MARKESNVNSERKFQTDFDAAYRGHGLRHNTASEQHLLYIYKRTRYRQPLIYIGLGYPRTSILTSQQENKKEN